MLANSRSCDETGCNRRDRGDRAGVLADGKTRDETGCDARRRIIRQRAIMARPKVAQRQLCGDTGATFGREAHESLTTLVKYRSRTDLDVGESVHMGLLPINF